METAVLVGGRPHQFFRRFPDVAGSSVMTVKSSALRVSGLAARSVITVMMVPGCNVCAIIKSGRTTELCAAF